MHIVKALARYELQLRANDRSPLTVTSYLRYVRLLAAWLATQDHSLQVEDVTADNLAAFLASDTVRLCPNGKRRKATAGNVLRSALITFFRHMAAADVIPRDPSVMVRRARCAPAPPRGLSPIETKKFCAALSKARTPSEHRDWMLFDLLLATGIRIGSALALEVRDVDLEQKLLWLRTTKGNRPERVFLSDAICRHLRRYLKTLDGSLVFPGRRRGRAMTDRHARRQMLDWLKRAGIRRHATPHSLRHSFAAGLLAKSGGDFILVQRALRHASIASTLIYLGPPSDRLAEVLDGVG